MIQRQRKNNSQKATESSKPLPSGKKTPTSLKPRAKVLKKPAGQNSAISKHIVMPSQTGKEDDKKNKIVDKEKACLDENIAETKKIRGLREGSETNVNEIGEKEFFCSKNTDDGAGKENEKEIDKGARQVGNDVGAHETAEKEKASPARKEDEKKKGHEVGTGSKGHEIDEKKKAEGNKDNLKRALRSGKKERRREENENHKEKLGGMIFMCNRKTKPDCFHYRVMALPAGKKEVVLGIKPGQKLFLYDFDLKMLYGIYESTSAGGMRLEPRAFGGGFPAQVRFKIYEDCLPLPESVFKKAIVENYDERTRKFKTELTVKQVKKLRALFRPASREHRDSTLDTGANKRIRLKESNAYSRPLFLSEKNYRSYGLRPERPEYGQSTYADVMQEPLRISPERNRQMPRDWAPIHREAASTENVKVSSSSLFLSENEYRLYGVRGQREQPSPQGDPYYDPYLERGQGTTMPPDSYSRERGREVYRAEPMTMGLGSTYRSRSRDPNERIYNNCATHEITKFNQGTHVGIHGEYSSAPVSSKYSFAGGSVSYR